MSRFSIPEEHLGNPIIVSGARNVPALHDAEYISQFPDTIKPLLLKAAELEAQARAITLIYREKLHITLEPGEAEAKAELERRTGIGNPCFALNDSGTIYGVGHIQVQGEVRVWNAYDPQLLNSLETKNYFPETIPAAHAKEMAELVLPDPLTLVCEIGAGSDIQRMKHLNREITDKGGVMICHDMPPALVNDARSKVGNIPYIFLPPVPEFLGEWLKSDKRKKTLTMKNVLSAMTPFDIEEIIKVAKYGEVENIVVTQSLGHPFKRFMDNKTAMRVEHLADQLALHKAQKLSRGRDVEILRQIFSYHSHQVMHAGILEIIRDYFFNRCQKAGFEHQEISRSSANVELDHNEALQFLKTKLGTKFAIMFNEALFNHILFFPAAIQYYQDRSIINGKLRVTSQQLHYYISRKKKVKSPRARELVSHYHPANGLPIPALVALEKNGVLPSGMPLFQEADQKRITDDINYIGLAITFDLLGKEAGIEPFNHYNGSKLEEKVYEAFGISVNT